MKTKYKIILILSLLLNVFFIGNYVIRFIRVYQTYKVKDIEYTEGTKTFFTTLKNKYPELSQKDYYYVNMWNSLCVPCIKEMPFIDSIVGTLDHERVGYVYLTDDNEEIENKFFQTHQKSSNFGYLNSMNDFISAVCIEKNHGNKELPMHLIIDKTGKILYFKTGTFDYMELLPGHTKQQEEDAKRFNTPPFVKVINDLLK